MTQCDNVTLYFYDELDAREREAFKAHLDGCPRCRRELAFLNETRQALQAPAAPQAVVEGLFAKTTRKKSVFTWLKPALASAAVLGLGVFILMAGMEANRPAYDRQEVLAYLTNHVEADYQAFEEALSELENEF